MVDNNHTYMKSYQEKISKSVPSFDRKNLSAVLIICFGMVMMGGYGASQVASGYDVSIGQNGIEMGTGTLDVLGNDIENSGTTIWDASNGYIPAAQLDNSGLAGSFLNVNGNALDVDAASIQSGTTASDVGLGNVDNTDELDLDGSESMNADLDLSSNNLDNVAKLTGSGSQSSSTITVASRTFELSEAFARIDASSIGSSLYFSSNVDGSGDSDVRIAGPGRIVLHADDNGNDYKCYVDQSNGDFNCDGTKNWVHDLGNGSEAYYTSQESPEVRAVYEGQVDVTDGTVNVSLAKHFSKTVSDSEPKLRTQVTPHELATVAVTERTDDYLVIESSKDVKVDYRITGIREGYEDKQVVRPKQ